MKPTDWIPFSKRKPKKGQSVLLLWPPGFVKDSIFPNGWQPKTYTHWQPLVYPLPPEIQIALEYAWNEKHRCWTKKTGPRNAPLVVRPIE